MTSPQSLDELIEEGMRLSRALEEAINDLFLAVGEEADAENAYRKQRAMEWAACRMSTAAATEQYVNGATADLRQERDLARGLVMAGREHVRSLRTQVSLIQTAITTRREEAAYGRTGPDMGP